MCVSFDCKNRLDDVDVRRSEAWSSMIWFLSCGVYFSSYFCLFVLSLLVCRSCQVGWLQWWGKTQYITLIYPHLSSIVLIVFIWLYIHSFHRKRFLLDVEVGVGHLLVFNSCRRDAWCVECSQIRAECSPVNDHFYWDDGADDKSLRCDKHTFADTAELSVSGVDCESAGSLSFNLI